MRPAVGLAASALAVLVLVGATAGADRLSATRELEDLRADDALYFAGDSVEGFPLAAVLRRSDTAEFVSFVYGDCAPADEVGCAPPIEIQVWPACRRHLALYGSAIGPDLQRVSVRGVPGAVLDDGTRIELQTGRSTIVVFADSPARLGRIVNELRTLDAQKASGGPLPAPARGASDGRLAC